MFSFRCVLYALLLACSTQIACAGTVAFWTFEEGTADAGANGINTITESANTLHGTPVGGPVYRSVAIPSSTLALEFDGSNDRVVVADDLLFRLDESMTLEATVQPFSSPSSPSGAQILFRGDSRPGKDSFNLRMRTDNRLEFQVFNEIDGTAELVTPDPLSFTQLQHIAGTLDDATGEMKLFINGALVASTSTSIRGQALLDPLRMPGIGIGALNHGGQYFHGLIDNVRISDMALTPDEFVAVPEPSTLVLAGCALLGLVLHGWRRRSRSTSRVIA